MISPDFQYFPRFPLEDVAAVLSGKLERVHVEQKRKKREYPLWVYDDSGFLVALVAFLKRRHDGRYPEYRFEARENTLYVQIWLDDKQKEFIPGEYQPEFDRIISGCIGFEAGWIARS